MPGEMNGQIHLRKRVRWSLLSGPLCTLGLYLALEALSTFAIPILNPFPIFQLTVVYAAFRGGVRMGLLSALIVIVYALLFFDHPELPLHYTAANLSRVVVITLTTPSMALLVGFLKRRAVHAAIVDRRNTALRQEIADRKRIADTLRSTNEALRTLIQSSPLAIVVFVPRTGLVRLWNPAAEQLFGWTAQETIGAAHPLLPHDQQQCEGFWALCERVCQGEIITDLEEQYETKTHTQVFCTVALAAIRSAETSAPMVLSMLADVTERRRAAEEVARLQAVLEQRVIERTAALQAANKELEVFSYAISHDLRAPLRSIDGLSRIVLEDYGASLNAEGQRYLQRIQAASQRMGEMLEAMLALARLSRGAIHHETVHLSALAETIARDLRQTQPERQVDFVIAADLVAQGDPHLLREVLQNLLGNAWKYTTKHPTARIEFGVDPQPAPAAWMASPRVTPQRVYFVRDDGAGFDMEYASSLFGVFQRLHTATEFPGTGVGLAAVQWIIRRHGGEVWAEAAVEQGATFYFTLPSVQDSTPL